MKWTFSTQFKNNYFSTIGCGKTIAEKSTIFQLFAIFLGISPNLSALFRDFLTK
jgi:hypothetical protein